MVLDDVSDLAETFVFPELSLTCGPYNKERQKKSAHHAQCSSNDQPQVPDRARGEDAKGPTHRGQTQGALQDKGRLYWLY